MIDPLQQAYWPGSTTRFGIPSRWTQYCFRATQIYYFDRNHHGIKSKPFDITFDKLAGCIKLAVCITRMQPSAPLRISTTERGAYEAGAVSWDVERRCGDRDGAVAHYSRVVGDTNALRDGHLSWLARRWRTPQSGRSLERAAERAACDKNGSLTVTVWCLTTGYYWKVTPGSAIDRDVV